MKAIFLIELFEFAQRKDELAGSDYIDVPRKIVDKKNAVPSRTEERAWRYTGID